MPLEQERKVYRFQQGYGEMLLEAFDGQDPFTLTCEGGVHPGWVFGHLAMVGHGMCKRLGAEGAGLDEDRFKSLFGLGTQALDDASRYPAFEELVASWRRAHERLDAAAASASPDVLDQPNPNARMKAVLPTLHDLASFVMTAHEAMHLGQISTWRRSRGLPPLF